LIVVRPSGTWQRKSCNLRRSLRGFFFQLARPWSCDVLPLIFRVASLLDGAWNACQGGLLTAGCRRGSHYSSRVVLPPSLSRTASDGGPLTGPSTPSDHPLEGTIVEVGSLPFVICAAMAFTKVKLGLGSSSGPQITPRLREWFFPFVRFSSFLPLLFSKRGSRGYAAGSLFDSFFSRAQLGHRLGKSP